MKYVVSMVVPEPPEEHKGPRWGEEMLKGVEYLLEAAGTRLKDVRPWGIDGGPSSIVYTYPFETDIQPLLAEALNKGTITSYHIHAVQETD